jgi:Patatin-like phospholipase
VSVFTEHEIAGHIGYSAILASAAVPGFFPPVDINGDVYVDGGALMNTPLMPAARDSDCLHVVYLDPSVGSISIESLQRTLGVIDRMLLMFFAYSMNQDISLIGDYNRTLALASSLDPTSDSDPQVRALARAAAAVSQWVGADRVYGPTTIHRYHPSDDLGGALGFLDLSYDQVKSLIDRGYHDAVNHNCVESGCVLPGPGTTPPLGAHV